jgi:pimeloyl-[acyl-carrier protein] methyl ester esterase
VERTPAGGGVVFLVDGEPTLHVVAVGAGPPVLLVGGWSASWEAWEPTIGELSRSARCIAPDTRGTGWSDGGDDSVTLGDLVHDVFRVLDALDAPSCVIAGESLGGVVALHAVARHPSRFTGICLVSTPVALDPRTATAVIEGCRADYPATVRTFVQTSLPEPGTAHLVPWAEELFLATRPGTAVQLIRAATEVPLPDTSGLGVPAVVVHGTADAVVPVEQADLLAARLPRARVVRLPGAGHAPSVTRPQDVADAIRSLLPPTDADRGGPRRAWRR